ncbi:MAG TPA: rhodanese-like domain-containing protein [Bacteroidales bacterium]|nr:rhodanese-like domain-containing protein [Bacteroidales bacterium]HPF02474.1 rhodanese-like domain-containing protein [Bacteroidales bacterium]HPJ59980.1 rhodanese-like domain-containing protein [Bacteroidales bacterium]HPR12903.1 rhodanese-like domain-containing protein [Bacteroidales bacterium]HRW85964.1 rhodanese-like domain-containing protein [Bacteroidales bacterium]
MKKFATLLLLQIVIVLILPAQVTEQANYTSVDPYEFHMLYLLNDSALVIDVREPFEYRGRRIRDAINIPSSGNLEFASDTIDWNYILLFYCTTDWRSIRVAEYFYERGFRKVYSLRGGIVAWKKEGYPTIKREKRKRRK